MIRRFVGIALPIVLATALATGQSTGRSDATFREIVSGQSHQHPIRAAAGDVVDGTFDVRAVAVRISVRDPKDEEVRSFYFFGPNPEQRRIGFVADTAGQYRIEVSAYDRFDSGPQTDLGAPVPIRGAARGAYALRLEARSVASRMTGIAPARDGMPRSARLQRLALDLAGGRRQALDEFWRERATKGPLVERLDGDERHELVTFLWRERYDTRNVFLSWEMASDRETTSFMKQLPGTDVWYVALRLRRGSRFTYLLSPNHLPADAVLTTRRDPLNVRVEPEDPTYPYERASVLDMPGAPDEQWSRRMPSRRGVVEQKRFASNVMKNERDIWVYTPPGYTKTAGPYPLVVFFDGPAYVSSRGIDAPRTIDNLVGDGKIKAPIVCFLAPVNRGAEQGGTLAAQYRQAIVTELLPTLRAEYPLTTAPRDTVIAGFSNGGMAAALLALHHSSVFGNVLSQSAAFRLSRDGDLEPNTISRTFIAEPTRPIRFFLETGFYDNVPAIDAPLHERVLEQSNLMGNRHFRDVLRAKGYEVVYDETGGTHEVLQWRAMLARGLMSLLGFPDQRR